MQREGPELTPPPENAGREIDFKQVKKWITSLEEQTKGIPPKDEDEVDDWLSKIVGAAGAADYIAKANAIVGFTKDDEKNYWDRDGSEKISCSCGDWRELPGCPENTEITFKDGAKMPAVPYGQENRGSGVEEVEEGRSCHDCACLPGNFHHPGCDMEECPRCGGQAISCDCLNGYVNEEAGRKAKRRDCLAALLEEMSGSRSYSEIPKRPQTLDEIKSALQGVIEGVIRSGDHYKDLEEAVNLDTSLNPNRRTLLLRTPGMNAYKKFLEIAGYFEWLDSER